MSFIHPYAFKTFFKVSPTQSDKIVEQNILT